ncbi:DEAD-box ATP-dependent RNA helicase 16, partial [Trifolium medium]|nr:DEAD-box ATP-dependent RNA helicase 16 [Trifolium medium]
VINFEMPRSVAGYVHRIGRTGRAYNSGASISLMRWIPSKKYNLLLGTMKTMAQTQLPSFPYSPRMQLNLYGIGLR